MAQCEDYPCCGHTDGLGCDWVAPDYRSDPHALCDHEAGICELPDDADDADLYEQDEDEAYPPDHDCPKDRFLTDPITLAYGVGSEMVGDIRCRICDEWDAEHPS